VQSHRFSVHSSHGESDDYLPVGFDGETREEVMEELSIYLCEKLAAMGKGTPELEKTFMENIPDFNHRTRKGGRNNVTRDFEKVAKTIKPDASENYLNWGEWWHMLYEAANDQGWSMAMTIRMLARSGGMAPGVNDAYKSRIITLMKGIKEWLPAYDSTRSEDEGRYWLNMWVEVGLKMAKEFHQLQPTEKIEEGLRALMAESKYAISAAGKDPLNSQFHKVDSLQRGMYAWLRERSSSLTSAPLYMWKMLTEWLTAQVPIGPLMMIHITKALGKLATDPESVFPHYHSMSKSDVGLVKRQGSAGATEEVYGLILERLKDKALAGELVFEFQTMDQIASIQRGSSETSSASGSNGGGWQVANRKKTPSKVNSVTTDFSTLTMNTTTTAGGQGGQGRPNFRVCDSCRLFHQKDGKKCLFWDAATRKFGVKAFLLYRSVRLIGADGKSTLSKYWSDKLLRWTFPHIGVTAEGDKQKILKDLRDAAAALPKATASEIAQSAKDSQTFVSMAMAEEKAQVNLATLQRESDGMMVNSVARRDKQSAKAAKRKRLREKEKARKEEESSSEDEDSEDDASTVSGY